ncbi:MAG: redoxin domain-containing protein [Anaerolineaceae bacterium]|nr:redoxin domain-containing protein [Anaerolineaceae bacterium]
MAIGDIAVDFELKDTNGNLVHLADFQGKKNVVLVLVRGFM